MANLFEAAQKVADNPVDPKSREDLEKARKEVEDALLYVNSAKQGLLADPYVVLSFVEPLNNEE
jgi:hypothetical protein